MTRSFIPVPGTTTGRLVVAALDLFGAFGFGAVTVGTIAERAGVTTGSLYHHFGSKAGLYDLVRADVEQRVLDRFEGAAAGRSIHALAGLAPVLLVGFDYLVASGFTRLLAEPSPEPGEDIESTDVIQHFVSQVLDGPPPLSALIAAAWREALMHAGTDEASAQEARDALQFLFAGE